MKPFRERNPVTIGAIGLVLIGMLMYVALDADAMPFLGGGKTYTAHFREAGGLKADNEVRVAGVRVGEVSSVELEGSHVRVEFQVEDDTSFGAKTGASIRVKTLLGQKYLSLEPAGGGQLDPNQEIPLARTVAPYDVVDAFSDFATTTERIDTGQLTKALDTLSTTFKDTPDEVRDSLRGLTRLSKTISSRDAQLRKLLGNSKKVTKVLSERDDQLVKLVRDANLVLREIKSRRAVIHQLLVTAQTLSKQLSGVIQDNEKQLKPALTRLGSVVGLLRKNQKNLDQSIERLAPFVRVFANTLGNGPWFDTYIYNIAPVPGMPRVPGANAGSGGANGAGGTAGGGGANGSGHAGEPGAAKPSDVEVRPDPGTTEGQR